MSTSLEDLVYDTSDPLRHIGRVEALKGKKAWVRWHRAYASWVEITKLSTDVQDKVMGDKLGPVAT
jgi:hypothetical protein